ncbi:MAG TPA: NADH-quinone oxidoreductase subunit D, partial [Verrucomicrobiae bacterium]|nr:NADH-quinone oxidoreductase subunit D [Verrucomicrobiae bacterium]
MSKPARQECGGRPHPGAEVQSFYHLNGCSLAGKFCSGAACFVARHLNPGRWRQAEIQQPRVYCLGQCHSAPAAAGPAPRPQVGIRSRQPVVLERVATGGVRALHEYVSRGGYRALEKAVAMEPSEVVDTIELSALRGRGGAAFPTGRKWRAVLGRGALSKYVIANADEGDPGAYIDRFLMEDDPFALLEGMTVAGRAVGAAKGWIYLRAEYPAARPVLEAAIAEARNAGLLGNRILGHAFSFDVEVFVGQGSYICGEETALIRSLEG